MSGEVVNGELGLWSRGGGREGATDDGGWMTRKRKERISYLEGASGLL